MLNNEKSRGNLTINQSSLPESRDNTKLYR